MSNAIPPENTSRLRRFAIGLIRAHSHCADAALRMLQRNTRLRLRLPEIDASHPPTTQSPCSRGENKPAPDDTEPLGQKLQPFDGIATGAPRCRDDDARLGLEKVHWSVQREVAMQNGGLSATLGQGGANLRASATSGDSAYTPLRARRAPLLGVLHRPHPKPQHPPRLPRGGPALRRMERAMRPRPRPGRAHGGRGLHRAALRCARAGLRQAAPRRVADALRLARRRPGPAVQSRAALSGARSTSSRPARPRCSPRRRPERSSTASTSRSWSAFATARSSACSSTASRARVLRSRFASPTTTAAAVRGRSSRRRPGAEGCRSCQDIIGGHNEYK